jgi:phosphohistidine swiveling domain-containing protein
MLLVLPHSTEAFARTEAGGKGYNLYLMTRHGLPVPRWAILGKQSFQAFVTHHALAPRVGAQVEAFLAGARTAEQAAQAIATLIEDAPMPPAIRALVDRAWEVLGHPAEIAVRSSAADEDSATHSFAGQLSSSLYVPSADEAARAVKQCWASAFSARALVYRREHGLDGGKVAVAVIFQQMLDPEASGVLFTCDPLTNTDDRYLVSAVYGVGEGLVSGALAADSYWVEATTGALLQSEIVTKSQAVRRGGMVPVDPSLCEVPVLDAEARGRLHALGQRLMTLYHHPQDVEWAVCRGTLYVLQARPVTTLNSNLRGFPNLWDNSNIVESYGGVTLPLSFTFALKNYHGVYVQFCELLGVPQDVVKDMDAYLRNMLGSINGRVFYNLFNWYKLVGVLPGFKHNRQFMETMMGVRVALSPEIADRIRPHPSWDTWRGKVRQARTGLAFLYYHVAIQRIVDRFLADFRTQYQAFRALDYRRMPSDMIFGHYLAMDRAMLARWQAPIINDFLAMVHFGLLKRLTERWLSGLDANVQNDLLCGEGNLESAEPTRALITLAAQASADPALRAFLLQTPPAEAYEALNQSPFTTFFAQITDYIDRFGFRCMSEMKLEEIDLFTDPSFLFTCLGNYLRQGITDLSAYEAHKGELRAGAETAVRRHLPWCKRLVYCWALTHARKSVRNRENTRFARTRAYGVARSMFQAMGEALASSGVLREPRDIFYLELDEIYGLHQGTLTVSNLPALVALRQQAYAAYAAEEPQIRFLTRGPVYWQNAFLTAPDHPDIQDGADYDLKGLPCCPGVVEGRVRVVLCPADAHALDGEILVAPRTDPGWVPLYPSCAGLLVERGSLLSHSAIVAREMGLPAIVGIAGLTRTLRTGMRVRMDGTAGTVTICAS